MRASSRDRHSRMVKTTIDMTLENIQTNLEQLLSGQDYVIFLTSTIENHFKYYTIVVRCLADGMEFNAKAHYGRINHKPNLSDVFCNVHDAHTTASRIYNKLRHQKGKGYVLIDKNKFYTDPNLGTEVFYSTFQDTVFITYKKVSVDEVPKGKSKKEVAKDKRFNDLIFE
jgi:hypothetical protein